MTAGQFKIALYKSACSDYNHNADINVFDGFGLRGFQPVYVTYDQIAALISYQARQFNGEYDQSALDDIKTYGRKLFQVIDPTQ